jgi:hypothetical protein
LKITSSILLLFVLIISLTFSLPAEVPLVKEENGKLVYSKIESGDRIPDFSYCGYKGGGIAFPDVQVQVTLNPNPSGDDTKRIQKALDEVEEKTLDKDGIRGAVLLKAGTYRVEGTLKLSRSGVILRGEGQNTNGTIIIATGTKKRSLIQISGSKMGKDEIPGTRKTIAQDYVPLGSRSFKLVSADSLEKGDDIIVYRPATKEWIKTLEMDKLNRGAKDKVKNWTPESYNFEFQRTITDIKGDTITIDAPIVFAIDKKFGGGSVYKCNQDLRVSNVGVENLRLVSEYSKGKEKSDEKHAWDGIKINKAVDCWVRNVTSVFFGYSCVNISSRASHITVQDCACLDPVSKISGGRRYSFALAGQKCLIQRCYTRHGRHDYVMHARVKGPNVFLDCVADITYSDSGPHHRWATGTLYDNIACGRLNVQNRGRSGTGHGWAGANMVFWNCKTKSIICAKPTTANNYSIGCTGKIRGNGYIESKEKPVKPRSLYIKQLEERLGKKAVDNIVIPEQLKGNIDDYLRQQLAPLEKSLYK